MPAAKKYFHDKAVLLLLTVNLFLVFLNTVLIFWRLGSQQTGGGYVIQYRADVGVGAFKTGGIVSILSFIVFGLLVFILHSILSLRAYNVRRQVALVVLGLGTLLLLLSIIVSNALLALR